MYERQHLRNTIKTTQESIEIFNIMADGYLNITTMKITARKVDVFGVFLVRMRENADQNNSEYGRFYAENVRDKITKYTIMYLRVILLKNENKKFTYLMKKIYQTNHVKDLELRT